MKASELTMDLVRHAILPATSMKDQEATMKWLATPEALRQTRNRAAERIAALITTPNMPRRAAPLNIPAPSEPPAHVSVDSVESPAVATVTVHQDGTTVLRPSSPPPAPVVEAPVRKSSPPPAPFIPEPEVVLPVVSITPEEALQAIRKAYLDWKGGQYVCGNAFKRMHEVESIIAKAGF